MAQGHEFVVMVTSGKLKPATQRTVFCGQFQRPLEGVGQGLQLFTSRSPIKATYPDIDGVNFPTAQEGDNVITGFFQGRPFLTISG